MRDLRWIINNCVTQWSIDKLINASGLKHIPCVMTHEKIFFISINFNSCAKIDYKTHHQWVVCKGLKYRLQSEIAHISYLQAIVMVRIMARVYLHIVWGRTSSREVHVVSGHGFPVKWTCKRILNNEPSWSTPGPQSCSVQWKLTYNW